MGGHRTRALNGTSVILAIIVELSLALLTVMVAPTTSIGGSKAVARNIKTAGIPANRKGKTTRSPWPTMSITGRPTLGVSAPSAKRQLWLRPLPAVLARAMEPVGKIFPNHLIQI